MDKDSLQVNLNYLVNKYIKNDSIIEHLQTEIKKGKAKYILVEIDHNKCEAYTEADAEMIKDIAFYFC